MTQHNPKKPADSESASKAEPKKILFVCMGNCVRSQMAEAIAKHIAQDIIIAESAGVSPLGFIDKTVCEVLTERSISYEGQYSKGLHSHKLGTPHLVVNMSGLPGRSLFHEHDFEDWMIRDPFGEDVSAHREVLDDIQRRIEDLAARLRSPELESE
ncbi:MAG: low molecular weight phosphatase family protein [Candidatus Acidiferrales bacterium]